MLFLAEGSIHRSLSHGEREALHGWWGPMMDSGFMQTGYLNLDVSRLWFVLSADSAADIQARLHDIPLVADQTVTFAVAAVTALRYS